MKWQPSRTVGNSELVRLLELWRVEVDAKQHVWCVCGRKNSILAKFEEVWLRNEHSSCAKHISGLKMKVGVLLIC